MDNRFFLNIKIRVLSDDLPLLKMMEYEQESYGKKIIVKVADLNISLYLLNCKQAFLHRHWIIYLFVFL